MVSHRYLPGDSNCPFHPLVGGHLTPWKGHLTISKRSLWITRYLHFVDVWGKCRQIYDTYSSGMEKISNSSFTSDYTKCTLQSFRTEWLDTSHVSIWNCRSFSAHLRLPSCFLLHDVQMSKKVGVEHPTSSPPKLASFGVNTKNSRVSSMHDMDDQCCRKSGGYDRQR